MRERNNSAAIASSNAATSSSSKSSDWGRSHSGAPPRGECPRPTGSSRRGEAAPSAGGLPPARQTVVERLRVRTEQLREHDLDRLQLGLRVHDEHGLAEPRKSCAQARGGCSCLEALFALRVAAAKSSAEKVGLTGPVTDYLDRAAVEPGEPSASIDDVRRNGNWLEGGRKIAFRIVAFR